jgi:cobyrinic acid a,c-diamide synthase
VGGAAARNAAILPRQCPALLIGAPASGQGKTTVTAALARSLRSRGLHPRVFKTGADFLDPMILERASGAPVHQLDLWMVGEARCRRLLYEAAGEADVILVEGVMGLFDGQPSSADLAARFGLPVLAVIDASAMAQTFGAIAHGLTSYRGDIQVAGVIANRVAGPGHAEMLARSVGNAVEYFGYLPQDAGFALPERHLGLFQAREVADIDTRLDSAARAIEACARYQPPMVTFHAQEDDDVPPLLDGVRIGVARDTAFSFIYPDNLDLLEKLGAEPVFFSPLEHAAIPTVDSLWFPGGYPELHLERLAANTAMKCAIREHHADGKPILAECGGMLYLVDTLSTTEGQSAAMAGLMPGDAAMQPNLTGLGLQSVELPCGTLRGHTFHHSRLVTDVAPVAHTHSAGGPSSEAVYQVGSLVASYIHFYFPSNPGACAALFRPEIVSPHGRA